MTLAWNSAFDTTSPRSLSSRFRAARGRVVLAMIERIIAEKGRCRVLDVGGRLGYWWSGFSVLPQELHLTIQNLGSMWCSASVGTDEHMITARLIGGDACALDLPNNSFDLVHSNSVIEHVGDWSRMEAFAREVRRLAPAYYVQTPNFWFPVEPHFRSVGFHWLPEQTRARVLLARKRGAYSDVADMPRAMHAVQGARILDKAQLAALFPDAILKPERVLGLTKSWMAIRHGETQ